MFGAQMYGIRLRSRLVAIYAFIHLAISLAANQVYAQSTTVDYGITGTAIHSSSLPTSTSPTACREVAASVGSRNITGVKIPASLAWDCLQSVPLDVPSAVAWLESLKPYIQWQSTLAYVADPPPSYKLPALDINAEIDRIIAGAKAGNYTNEYSLELDLYLVIQRVHDEHFFYFPNLIANVFDFGRSVALVSVTQNNTVNETPKVYVYGDVLLYSSSSSFKPSAVTHIDGTNVTSWLESFSELFALQDRDALWNSLFFSLASSTLGSISYTFGSGFFSGDNAGKHIYPGPNTVLKFENGTTSTYENFAQLIHPFTNITSGADVFRQFVAPIKTITSSAQGLPNITRYPGYPIPVAMEQHGLVSGYYLEGSGYQDVALLSIPTFNSFDPNNPGSTSFQDTTYKFIDRAKADGKTKLVIDLSANGGGFIPQGIGLFVKLFPDLAPILNQRIRATESVDHIGTTLAAVLDPSTGRIPRNTTGVNSTSVLVLSSSPLNYLNGLDANDRLFQSWPAKFGPVEYHGDNFTNLFRYNITQLPLGDLVDSPSRPFKAENIIILTDGTCASTCTIFVELATHIGGVKTVVTGGRPQSKQPMQALGGTKGCNNIGWSDISNFVNGTRLLTPAAQQAAFNASPLATYNQLPFQRGGPYSNSINFRDSILPGDDTGTPAQFVYEPADCRIWMSMPMLVDVSVLWREVVDVGWGGKACVATGNTTNSTPKNIRRSAASAKRGKIFNMPRLSPPEVALLRRSSEVKYRRAAGRIARKGST